MLSDSKSSTLVPPRLLAGVTMLYWGAMTGEPVIALLVAVLLEGKNWVKWSWDFDDSAYVKAFQISLGLLGFVLLMVWLNEVNHNSLFQVMKWFPVCLLPIELAQRYGKRRELKLNTFFYFSRLRMKQDIKEGRDVDPNTFNTGYPYLFIVLVVASCTGQVNVFVQGAMLIIISAVIVAVSVKRGLGWKRLIWAIPVMLFISVWIQIETATLYKTYKAKFSSHSQPGEGDSSPHLSYLGQLGNLKENNKIHWRMWGENVPQYVRLNSYNKCFESGWSYDYKADKNQDFEDMDEAFDSRGGVEVGGDGAGLFVFNTDHEAMVSDVSVSREVIKLRGAGQSDTEQSIVPSAEGLFAIANMAGDNVIPAVNPVGVLKLVNRSAVIDYELWNTDFNLLDSKPDLEVDLKLGKSVVDPVTRLSNEIGLDGIESIRDKVNAIRDFFILEFTYALHFDVPKTNLRGSNLERFMHEDRRGHCEYFATTAALLFREQGIPARYCIGYVVREKDGDAWIMRGAHAHAWCSVWIDNKWEIVDLTPPDWLSMENQNKPVDWSQEFKDWVQNVQQDFTVWRADEKNKSLMSLLMWLLGVILLGWFGYKLYKSRAKEDLKASGMSTAMRYKLSKEFKSIEGDLSLMIGERAEAQTYYKWVNGAKNKLDSELLEKLLALVLLHEESRFGGKDTSSEMLKLCDDVKSLVS